MFRKHSDPDCEVAFCEQRYIFYSYLASPNCNGKIHIRVPPQAQTFLKNSSINGPFEMGINVSRFALNFCYFYNELWWYPVFNILDTSFSAKYIIARDTLEVSLFRHKYHISFLIKKNWSLKILVENFREFKNRTRSRVQSNRISARTSNIYSIFYLIACYRSMPRILKTLPSSERMCFSAATVTIYHWQLLSKAIMEIN